MSTETDKVGATEETKPETGPAPDSEEAILSKVKTIDEYFASKSEGLRKQYVAFGEYAGQALNPKDSGKTYVHLGTMFHNIMTEEFKATPGSYDREGASVNCKAAARLAGVPESRNLPHEFAAAFWLCMLDRSTPGGPGEPRTFSHEQPKDDWFAGNVSYAALRVLFPLIKRASKNDELDSWEFTSDVWEGWCRDILKRLRAGQLVVAQIEALLKAKKLTIAKEVKAAAHAGLTKDEIESIEASENVEKREKKLKNLGDLAIKMNKYAAKELGMGKNEVTDYLGNKSIIRPDRPTVHQWAKVMTIDDAETLIMVLSNLALIDPSRGDVLQAMVKAAIVAHKSQAASKPAAKLAS
jgi:hypothetical protein